MTNAREELIEHIGSKAPIVEFISIAYRRNYRDNLIKVKGTLKEVLGLLDFNYDSGYGGQVLNGYIWYTDMSWSDRWEYDGSERWIHQVRPNFDIEIDVP